MVFRSAGVGVGVDLVLVVTVGYWGRVGNPLIKGHTISCNPQRCERCSQDLQHCRLAGRPVDRGLNLRTYARCRRYAEDRFK